MTNPVSKRLTVAKDSKNRPVVLELEIEHKGPEKTTTGEVITRRTVHLEDITEYDTLSICGTWAHGGGQIHQSIREALAAGELTPLIPIENLTRILDIWSAYHLNDLNAGTYKQSEALRLHYNPVNGRYEYRDACAKLRSLPAAPYIVEFQYLGQDEDDPNRGKWIGADPGTVYETRAEANARAEQFQRDTGRPTRILPVGNMLDDCETRPGVTYHYGSAWLVGALPETVKAEALQLFSAPTAEAADTRSELQRWIDAQGLKFEAVRVASRPDGLMDDDGQDPGRRHFHCRITSKGSKIVKGKNAQPVLDMRTRRTMSLYFTQGSAHTEPPTLASVLESLAMDAGGYENARDFNDWANQYGFDTDSRKAEKIYRAAKRQAEQLKRTIGTEAFTELLEMEL